MKKKILISSIAGVFFVACLVVIILYSVGVFTPIKVIEIDTTNVQTEFYIGEDFSSQGLTARGHRGDEHFFDITNFVVDSSKFDTTKEGEYEIFVTCEKAKTTYKVRVLSNSEVASRIVNEIIKDENIAKVNSLKIEINESPTIMAIGDYGFKADGNNEIWVEGKFAYIHNTTSGSAKKVAFIKEFPELDFTRDCYKQGFVQYLEVNNYRFDKIEEKGDFWVVTVSVKDSRGNFHTHQIVYNRVTGLGTLEGENLYSKHFELSVNIENMTLPQKPNLNWKG
jgi:hypothetical protein